MDKGNDTEKARREKAKPDPKEARLKAALKANLQRRKAQTRARKADQAE